MQSLSRKVSVYAKLQAEPFYLVEQHALNILPGLCFLQRYDISINLHALHELC